MKKSTLVLLLLLPMMAIVTGCEDAPPNSYVPQYFVEGYLVVDEPIGGIRLRISQPVTEPFDPSAGAVPDADVVITAGDRTFPLVFSGDSTGSYRFPDTTVHVEPNTTYRLEVRTKDGVTLTGETRTPGRVAWTQAPVDIVSIPPKTSPFYLNPPDSLALAWTPVDGVQEYLISVKALDTLEYGRYLPESTDVRNRRIDPDLDDQLPRYGDISRWGFLARPTTPIVWSAFKWYGKQEVTVWAADEWFVRWFKLTYWQGNPQYDPLQGNVRGEGGLGIFASASKAAKEMFVEM